MQYYKTTSETITLFLSRGRLFGSCTCGEALAVSTRRALEQGSVSCDCGAKAPVDAATIELLEAEELG